MARVRRSSPQPAPEMNSQRSRQGPALVPILEETAVYIDSTLAYVRTWARIAQGNPDALSHEPLLPEFDKVTTCLRQCRARLDDVKRASFSGLETVFERPQCDALEEQQAILRVMRAAIIGLDQTLDQRFRDRDTQLAQQSIHRSLDQLDQRTAQALEAWRTVSSRPSNLLCPAAKALIEGRD